MELGYVLYTTAGFVISFVLVGLYCAAEAAFTAANRMAIRTVAESGDTRAQIADSLLEDRPQLVRVLLVGINVFMVISSVLSASFMERTQVLGPRGALIGAASLVVITLVFAELVPKRIAQADPVGTAMRLALLVRISALVFSPIASLLGALPQWVAGRIARPNDDLAVTAESLSEMARLGEEQGGIEPETGEIIEGIISSGDTPVSDIMVPFVSVVTARTDTPLSDLANLAQKTGFSRFPVTRMANGPVVGMVHVKDVAARLFARQTGTSETILRPVLRTSPDTKAQDLLAEMRSRRMHLAVVETAPATPAGIVTIEDLLRDIL